MMTVVVTAHGTEATLSANTLASIPPIIENKLFACNLGLKSRFRTGGWIEFANRMAKV